MLDVESTVFVFTENMDHNDNDSDIEWYQHQYSTIGDKDTNDTKTTNIDTNDTATTNNNDADKNDNDKSNRYAMFMNCFVNNNNNNWIVLIHFSVLHHLFTGFSYILTVV